MSVTIDREEAPIRGVTLYARELGNGFKVEFHFGHAMGTGNRSVRWIDHMGYGMHALCTDDDLVALARGILKWHRATEFGLSPAATSE